MQRFGFKWRPGPRAPGPRFAYDRRDVWSQHQAELAFCRVSLLLLIPDSPVALESEAS